MKRYIFFVICAVIAACSSSVYAENVYLFDDAYVSAGMGVFYHSFSGMDDMRGEFTGGDEITSMVGLACNADLLLNKTFRLELPVGLTAGYKYQTMDGGYEYSSALIGTFERKVSVTNHIIQVSASYPLDDEKYYLLGVSAGAGWSKYSFSLKLKERSEWFDGDIDIDESAKGYVVPLGCFFDWGADGIGWRIGYEYVLSKYKKLDGSNPKASGNQIYLNLRYAI